MNLEERFYGDEINAQKILDSSKTVSLFQNKKLIVIRNAEKISAKTWETLSGLFEAQECTVLFLASKLDLRLKFAQAIQKAKDHCVLVKMEIPRDGEWNIWLESFLRELGKELAPEARELLNLWTYGSLMELKHALERAALFSGEDKTIRKSHIEAVAFRVSPEQIFDFSSAIMHGDRARALSQLETMLCQGEEPLALVGLLSRQYRWLLEILSQRAEGKTDAVIAANSHIFPVGAQILFPTSRRLGGKRVIQGLHLLSEADLNVKISKIPSQEILTNLVLELT